MQTLHSLLHWFDHGVAHAVQLLPGWFRPVMLAATYIGEPVVVICVSIIVGLIAVWRKMYRVALGIALGFAAFGINTAIKHFVHRARPDTLYAHSMKIHSYSFPSGHAFGSAFFYGLLAYLSYTRLPKPWNRICSIALLILILLIGISRVYLGAHFPSDVAAGWLFGGVSLFLVIKYAKP